LIYQFLHSCHNIYIAQTLNQEIGEGVEKKAKLKFQKQMKDLSKQEMRELLLINTYKLALLKCQVEAITDILVKQKILTREQIWKLTETNFEDSTI